MGPTCAERSCVQASTHVLIVEDDPLTAFMTARTLRMSDRVSSVTIAIDGRDAFELLRSGTLPSGMLLVVTDLSMPRMSGLELAAALRADPALRDQPVVVLSTSGEPADRAAAAALGVAGYFVKSHGLPHLDELLGWLQVFCPDDRV